MNRTLLITALFLGFSVAVFSQTGMIKYVDYGTKTGVYVDDTKADDRDIQFTFGSLDLRPARLNLNIYTARYRDRLFSYS